MTAKDYISWLLSLLSLFFTAYTFLYAKNLRRENFTIDEWKLDREALMQVTRDFDSDVDLLHSLTTGAHQIDELKQEIADGNRKIAASHRKLARELNRSTALKLPPALAYGAKVDQESAWDRLNEALAEIAALDDPAHVLARLSRATADGHLITSEIRAALDSQREMRSPR